MKCFKFLFITFVVLASSSFALRSAGAKDTGDHYDDHPTDEEWDRREEVTCPVLNEEDCSKWTLENLEACCPEEAMAEDLDRQCCFITPFLTRISAREAFHAYQTQCIEDFHSVLVIDVRTAEELYWVGQAAQTNKINLSDYHSMVPKKFETIIDTTGYTTLEYKLKSGEHRSTSVDDIEGLELSPIPFWIPVEFVDPTTGESMLNTNFGAEIFKVVKFFKPEAVIFYCRSGQRTSIGCYYGYCKELITDLRDLRTFEIELTDGTDFGEINGNGGFEGSSYSGRYNGYRGFPNRLTAQDVDLKVSFKDTGLPIIIGKTPNTLDSFENWKLPYACVEGGSDSPVCTATMENY